MNSYNTGLYTQYADSVFRAAYKICGNRPIVSGVLGSEDKHVVAFDSNENYLSFAQNILTGNACYLAVTVLDSSCVLYINKSKKGDS